MAKEEIDKGCLGIVMAIAGILIFFGNSDMLKVLAVPLIGSGVVLMYENGSGSLFK